MRDGLVRVWEYTELFPVFFDRIRPLHTECPLYAQLRRVLAVLQRSSRCYHFVREIGSLRLNQLDMTARLTDIV